MWSERRSATRPSPSRDSSSSGLLSGPCITAVPLAARLSTRRNQRLQCGGSESEPSRPRVTGWRLPRSVSWARNAPSAIRPLGSAGRVTSAGVGPRAVGAGVVRPRCHQHRAALTHIARDIVEIDDRQDPLPRVAVEDDELKFVDLLLEQLTGGESDQRELVDGRAVLLLRRAQDGEMHEVNARIGLEKITPGPLARMGLAGNQQDAQLVAHAVDRDDRAVVDPGELVIER